MAFWTNLINALFLPGRPILGSTGLALRDNLIAFAEGAPDAPRLALGALQRVAAGDELRSTTGLVSASAAAVTGGQTVSNTVQAFGMLQAGSVRIALSCTAATGNGNVSVTRRRGASTVTLATLTAVGTTTVDVDVLPGDAIETRAQASATSTTAASRAGQITISIASGDLWPGIPADMTGNTFNA